MKKLIIFNITFWFGVQLENSNIYRIVSGNFLFPMIPLCRLYLIQVALICANKGCTLQVSVFEGRWPNVANKSRIVVHYLSSPGCFSYRMWTEQHYQQSPFLISSALPSPITPPPPPPHNNQWDLLKIDDLWIRQWIQFIGKCLHSPLCICTTSLFPNWWISVWCMQ